MFEITNHSDKLNHNSSSFVQITIKSLWAVTNKTGRAVQLREKSSQFTM